MTLIRAQNAWSRGGESNPDRLFTKQTGNVLSGHSDADASGLDKNYRTLYAQPVPIE